MNLKEFQLKIIIIMKKEKKSFVLSPYFTRPSVTFTLKKEDGILVYIHNFVVWLCTFMCALVVKYSKNIIEKEKRFLARFTFIKMLLRDTLTCIGMAHTQQIHWSVFICGKYKKKQL